MALLKKINWRLSSNELKMKRKYSFFTISMILGISLILVNVFLIEKKYLRVKLCIYNSKNKQYDFESRLIPRSRSRVERIKDVVNELICGPVGGSYERLFSPDTVIQFVAMSKKGVVYISFNWSIVKSLRNNPNRVIDSIVTSIKKNIGEVKGVKILIEGVEAISTFNGIKLYKTFSVK